MMRSLLMATGALIVLSGCATAQTEHGEPASGYQFGDGLDAVLAYQDRYCAEASPVMRAVAISLIRAQLPLYPPSGMCTDVEKALFNELMRQQQMMGPIDLRRAQQDRQRALEGGR